MKRQLSLVKAGKIEIKNGYAKFHGDDEKKKPQITHRGLRPQPKKKCLHPMQS
jgi:hypothetical protein